MISDYDAVLKLKMYGHLPDVSLFELQAIDCQSRIVQDGLAYYQENLSVHSEIGFPDGILGPKTRRVLSKPRCGHPDRADHGIAEASVNDIACTLDLTTDRATFLRNAHQRMENVGSGSWPMPCQKQGVTVSFDRRNAPSGLDVDALEEVLYKIYRDVGLNLVPHEDSSRANIRISWRRFWGGTIGLAEYNRESCGDSVSCELSQSYFPNFVQVCELLKHEVGHNNNCPHTNGGTMAPTIRNGLRHEDLPWSVNDPTYPRLVDYHGGVPIDGPDPPIDPEDPKPPETGQGMVQLGNWRYDVSLRLREDD